MKSELWYIQACASTVQMNYNYNNIDYLQKKY